MDLQLDQLRALVAAVDGGTFEAAAQKLQVTPSAISQRIKALELAIGRVLLQRIKPVRPTASGEVVLRLARQFALLENDALSTLAPDRAEGPGAAEPEPFLSVPIVINSDSLATWALPALASVPSALRVSFDVFREDQDHSTARLRDGTVMAAITSVAEPVQGCIVTPLGRMRYRPMASPEFVRTWFPTGATVPSLAAAPVVIYDRTDDLQDRYLRSRSRQALQPPRHFIPASAEYAAAVRLGLGWGMLPDAQSREAEGAGELVDFDPGAHIDVALYWQQWKLHSPTLTAVADAIAAAAAAYLR